MTNAATKNDEEELTNEQIKNQVGKGRKSKKLKGAGGGWQL